MRVIGGLVLGGLMMAATAGAQQPQTHHWAIVVHGGAGDIDRATLGDKGDAAYRAALTKVIETGAAVLDRGGSSLDAVEAALRVLEDDPHFNAAKGAVFTSAGKTELDAAIMDGATMHAGSVASVTHTRYPISLARSVMEKTPYVLMVGPGADAYSVQAGMEQAPASYFFTESRWQSLVKQLTKEGKPIPPRPEGAPPPGAVDSSGADRGVGRHASLWNHRAWILLLDRQGNVAAGTSTGGLQGQSAGARGRLANHRRGHVCLEPVVRGFRHRCGRVLHPLHGGARGVRAGAVQGHGAAAGRGRSDPEAAEADSR